MLASKFNFLDWSLDNISSSWDALALRLKIEKIMNYSGDLKSDHVKSRLFEGQISNGPVFKWLGFCNGYSYSSNHLKTGPFKIQTFCSDFKWFLKNGSHFSWFQIVVLPDFRSHSKSRPFATQPLFDHSKSRLVQISDPHSISKVNAMLRTSRVELLNKKNNYSPNTAMISRSFFVGQKSRIQEQSTIQWGSE